MKHARFDILLVIVAIVWGTGFIGVQFSLDCGLPPSLIIALRMLLGTLVMLPIFYKSIRAITRTEFKQGVILGVLVFAGFITQFIGLNITGISSNAFLTTTNVVMVPFVSWAFLHKRPGIKSFIAAFTCLVGIAVLTGFFNHQITFNVGDVFSLVCAFFFSLQIAYIEKVVKDSNPTNLTFIQLAVSCVLAFIYFGAFESHMTVGPSFGWGIAATVYLGVACTFFAFWGQTVCQKHMSSSKTVLILSLESVFASIFSVLLGYDALTVSLVAGGLIIMGSILLLELNGRKRTPKPMGLDDPAELQ